jgi:hypothetical protein
VFLRVAPAVVSLRPSMQRGLNAELAAAAAAAAKAARDAEAAEAAHSAELAEALKAATAAQSRASVAEQEAAQLQQQVVAVGTAHEQASRRADALDQVHLWLLICQDVALGHGGWYIKLSKVLTARRVASV